jgi:poly(3-hydroxyoctanoate) depolymerase
MRIGGSLDMCQPLERSLTPLGYQTISFDLSGSGASPVVFPPRRMPGLARIALGVLDALDIGQADLLGVSFGGIVPQEVARLDTTRLRRVVLAATGPGLGGHPAHPLVLAHSPPRCGTGHPDTCSGSAH